MDILARLKQVAALESVPQAQLQWLVDEGELLAFEMGEYLFKPGDPIDRMLILLEGHVELKSQQGNQFRIIGSFSANTITGYLPYSRAGAAQGYAQVTVATQALVLAKSKFREMITRHEELTTALVHTMSSRIRDLTKSSQQNDKMMALGKLSAGLAHELNNPSAAIVRSAQNLNQHLKALPGNFKNVIRIRMTDEQVDSVNAILFSKIDSKAAKLSLMQKSALEDELLDWLEERALPDADDISENLAAFAFDTEALDTISEYIPEQDLAAVVNWINQVLSTERLIGEILDASQRINKLVSSVKSYTHMDQAPEKVATDVHEGLENTVTMLGHKLRKNNIEVIRAYDHDISKPELLVSEMNQVWTNIIDNAIDAMESSKERRLTLRTSEQGGFINVHIADTGPGIPEDVQHKIFDPFFTTKAIGKGTGLGMEVALHIVQQHQGSVTFETKPGFTEFKVCFPIK